MATAASITNPTTTPATTNPQNPQNLYQAIPGLSGLMGTAGTNISNLLSGMPSPSWAQSNAAYFGAGAGVPNTNVPGSFTANMGANLYNQQGQQNQQTGLSDLMNLIGTSSGNLAPSASQNQSTAFNYAQLGQQQNQFEQNFALQQFMDQVNALVALSQAGIGGMGGGGTGTGSSTGLFPMINGIGSPAPMPTPGGTTLNTAQNFLGFQL